MATREKCPVKGCLGFVEISTNGNGGVVERCSCCEKREAWRRQNLPSRMARCAVCGAEWEVKHNGRLPPACEGCKPLWTMRKARESKEKAARAPKPSVVRRIS
jgi:hypothetical protein